MAAPHVAGMWAILRQASPGASVSTLLAALRQTGLPVTDDRLFGTVTAPRARVFQALASIVPVANPAPSATAVTPAHVSAGHGAVTLTLTGSGFNGFSVVLWNGTPHTSAVLNTGTIQVSIADTELTGTGAQIAVVNPAPGGGTSAPLTVTINPPPSLTVSSTTASTGAPVTVTLVNGFGTPGDWLALAATGSANTQYVHVDLRRHGRHDAHVDRHDVLNGGDV